MLWASKCMHKEKVSAVGSVVAAIAASMCCIGPLVAVLLGTGSLAAASGLARWRPVFLGVTFALLGVAWYVTYRQPKAESCGKGAACAARPSAKGSKVLLWMATIFAIGFAALPLYAGALARLFRAESARPAWSTSGNVAIFKVKIESMNCAACAANIQRTLERKEGVGRAEIVYETKQGVIEYDPTRISPDTIIGVFDETGFKAEPLTKKKKQ